MNQATINKQTRVLTSYDLLKALALLLMVIDHVGFYFFPDENWFRVFGRICVPIWFFLIGYAKSRDIPNSWWIGALVLIAVSAMVGMPFFATNILVTMIAVRLSLDFISRLSAKNSVYFYAVTAILTILIIPTGFFTEYGTQGILSAMCGYFVRQRQSAIVSEDVKHSKDAFAMWYMVYVQVVYAVLQLGYFGFSQNQFLVVIVGVVAVSWMLLRFKPVAYAAYTEKMPGLVTMLLQICGRRTLEIYVVHLVLFKCLALYLGYESFGLFEVEWFEEGIFDVSPSEN